MKTIRVLAVAILLTLAGLSGVAETADASTRAVTSAALNRIAAGKYTAADLALVRNDPALAAQVPDPQGLTSGVTRSTLSSTATRVASTKTTAAATASCGHWVDVWFKQKSLLGSTIYIWHHRVDYCRTSAKVTKFTNRYDYLTHAQSIVVVRGLTVNQKGGTGTYTAWSHLQRHLEYCVVKYGCYANTYPWSKITVKASGSYTYKGAAH